MNWLKKMWQKVKGVEEKTVRARTEDGKFVADDKSTPDVNEAYTTVEDLSSATNCPSSVLALTVFSSTPLTFCHIFFNQFITSLLSS